MRKLDFALLSFVFLFISCSENGTNTLIEEPAGSAHYVINNKSDNGIVAVFTTSPELNSEVDTSGTISSQSDEIIFKDGIIGVNPKPSDSFSNIEFYHPSDLTTPVYTIKTINNEDWNIVRQSLKESGFGTTVYELPVTNEHLK